MCNWIWLGDEWDNDGDTCPPECGCTTPPPYRGTYIGQPGTTTCECP